MGSGRNEGGWRDDRGQRSMHDDNRSDSYAQRGRPGGGSSSERGFFERAGDEISSWFGDDEAERRREMDERNSGRSSHSGRGEWGRGEMGRNDYGRDSSERSGSAYSQQRWSGGDRPRDYPPTGDVRPSMGRSADYGESRLPERSRDMSREQSSYRPLAGDYGRSADDREAYNYSPTPRAQSERGAAGVTSAHDRHYSEWRQRQIEDLDRDYDEYRREHQSKFESDFSNWRSTRQSKRQLMATIKEQMQVVGSDDVPVGTVDKVRGDRLILTKADSADGQHHSLACSVIDRVEGDRVILDKKGDEAKALFGSEERDRALFERDDNREPGAHILNRSFSGTY